MPQSIGQVAVVVRDYDEALGFYVGTLGFTLVEDTYVPEQNKRWVVVSPPGATESRLLLARAADGDQATRIGNQTGGRVFLFLFTDDFWRDFCSYKAKGVTFIREPREEPYGTVAVFQDLYGNLWDLLQPRKPMTFDQVNAELSKDPRIDACALESEHAHLVPAQDAITGLRQALTGQFVSDEELDEALGGASAP